MRNKKGQFTKGHTYSLDKNNPFYSKSHSEKTRQEISKSKKGCIPWNKGKKGLQVAWNKGKSHIAVLGKNNPNWIVDRTQLAKRQERNDTAYGEWRKIVKDRDNWKCRIADKNCSGKVIAHHILGWSAFPELRYEVNNGITLCHFHHPRKRNDEMKLSPFFQELVKNA
jgi:hypothetical protein